MPSDSDFRLPVPGGDALPMWRRNSAYSDLGLSPESIAALDQSEVEEQAMATRLRERMQANRALIDQGNVLINQRVAEQLRTDALTENQLRDELASAIDQVNLARSKVTVAEQILERAQQRIVETATTLARFDDIDQRAADWSVDQLRRGIHHVGMPPDLIEARRAKADATDQHALAQQAHAMMAGELETARTQAEKAAELRDQCAVAVISRWCDVLATQIEAAQQHLYILRQQTLSVSSLWIPLAGVTAPLPVSDRVRTALRRGDDRPLLSEDVKAQARDWFILLQSDAHAVIGQ
jgi:hypothetical protein